MMNSSGTAHGNSVGDLNGQVGNYSQHNDVRRPTEKLLDSNEHNISNISAHHVPDQMQNSGFSQLGNKLGSLFSFWIFFAFQTWPKPKSLTYLLHFYFFGEVHRDVFYFGSLFVMFIDFEIHPFLGQQQLGQAEGQMLSQPPYSGNSTNTNGAYSMSYNSQQGEDLLNDHSIVLFLNLKSSNFYISRNAPQLDADEWKCIWRHASYT